MRYAIINADKIFVANVTTRDIEIDEFVIPLDDNEVCEKFYRYVPNETPRFQAPLPFNSWTAYQFLLRFTGEERALIRTAAQTDQNIADFLQLCQAAHEIENLHPMTLQAMNYLVILNIITEQRKNEILGFS